MIGDEEGLPELVGDPCSESAGDQQAANDIEPDGRPIHDEEVADRRHALVGRDAAPNRALLLDRHVHRRMPLHPPGDASIGLRLRLFKQATVQEQPEQHE